ncbi:hypothetical protein B0T20DRAFT_53955 [Sordaria brevicollis]|uniref:Zn(2)-C6 fungal-type domain-containing protein n=1 Tax=Sordaria brevicollis TaxID=83679 RepID=A0AAE0U658_SORBR|nr:hypothetical protein B0T20DRAFT_53955 [Sordaria brevicollis]
MTAINLEDSFDFNNIEVSYNETNAHPGFHSQPRDVLDKPPPRKRRRLVVSCTECHRRKQKCDRKLPCTNCVSRHKQDECQYDSGPSTSKEQQQQHQQQPKRARRTSSSQTQLTPPEPGFKGITDSITNEQWHHQQSSPDDDDNTNHQPLLPSTLSSITNLGYSSTTTTTSSSTLHFLHKIESHPEHSPSSPSSSSSSSVANNNNDQRTADHLSTRDCRDRYKSLIRQLPQRLYVEQLVDIYFDNFNWQYFMLDRDIFDHQLEEWYKVPWEVFNSVGPEGMEADLRVFPGLLFQVLAVSLLVLAEKSEQRHEEEGAVLAQNEEDKEGSGGKADKDKEWRESRMSRGSEGCVGFEEALKYASNMSFEDLAKEYSQAGMDILSLLGKREMTLETVLAGFVRASFLKFVGSVPEAWHAIATTIRDAQELGLHLPSLDPCPPPPSSSTTTIAEGKTILANKNWEIQRRRKIWLNLVSWDIHCGATLGRPSTVDITTDPPILPVDVVVLPSIRGTSTGQGIRHGPIVARTEKDPPTPLSRILFTWNITLHLVSILSLEREASSLSASELFSRVSALHQQLLSLEQSIPPFFRADQPNTTFDSLPSMQWLPWARCLLPQLISFNYMALHRAYIFASPWSREMAVEKGCLAMLQAQRRHWGLLSKEMRRRTFTLFFGTFDAVVLMGAVFVLFPPKQPKEVGASEEKELVREVVRQFKWAEERFEEMKERNPLARQARGVVRGIGERLGRALGEAGVELRSGVKEAVEGSDGKRSFKLVSVTRRGRGRALATRKVINPGTSTHKEPSPAVALPTAFVGGTCIASRDSSSTTPATISVTPGLPTPMSITPSALVQGQFGTATSDINSNNCFTNTFTFDDTPTECIPIDPSLDPSSASVPIPCLGAGVEWATCTASALPSTMTMSSLPEDFNWTNLSPLYATGDLVYNDLTGFMCDGFEFDSATQQANYSHFIPPGTAYGNGLPGGESEALGGGLVHSMNVNVGTDTGTEDAEDGMVELTRLEYDGSQGQSGEPLWMFDGRIDEGSVWGLLNRY